MNFRSLGQNEDVMGDRYVHSLDIRNHGRSPHADSMLWSEMAGDVVKFLDYEGYDQAQIVGHSLGGKIAMAMALLHPDRVQNLAVVDIAPVNYPPVSEPLLILQAMDELDLDAIHTRSDADEMLRESIPSELVRGFALQNLMPEPNGKMHWRLNLETLRKWRPYLSGFKIGGRRRHLSIRKAHSFRPRRGLRLLSRRLLSQDKEEVSHSRYPGCGRNGSLSTRG